MSKPLKEGYLVKAHPKEGLFAVTVWQKRYFILWPTGTMEYYTSYQKLPEEYCSTMDLKETIDILAPVSVGKKHNVIKLTVKKNNKDKDYWLDCDCPTLLNEWVRCMVNVAGLSPEDQEDCFGSNGGIDTTEPFHQQRRRLDKPSDAAKRRLPSLPMVMDMEYEIPNKEGEFYEEISPVHSPVPDEDINRPRRYSRVIGGGKQNIKGTEVVKNDMLKRSPLPLSDGSSPSPTMNQSPSGTLPVDNRNTSSPPPNNTPMRGVGTVNHQELQKRLSIRRQEMYDAVGNQVNQDSDGEAYEEVQFSAEVTVGDRNTAGVRLRNKQPLARNKDEVNPKLCSIPVKPAWDSTIVGNISSNSPDSEDISSKRPPMRVPLRDSVLLEKCGSIDFSSPPPIPPRETNTSSSSPPLYIQHGSSSPPPPIPNRVSSASIGGKRPKIQSYYTTEIKTPPGLGNEPPSIANGYNSESDQSSSGDSVIVRPTNKVIPSSTHGSGSSQPLSLLATVISPGSKSATSSGKPAPPISTKPIPVVKPATPSGKPSPPSAKPTPLGVKPTLPGVKPKPSTSPPAVRPKPNLKDNKSNPPPLVAKKPHTKSMAELKTSSSSTRDEHLHVNRAPAKLPKPAKISPTLPTKDPTPPAMTPKKKQISAPTVIGSPELPRKGVVSYVPPLPSKHNTAPALPPRNGPSGSTPLTNTEGLHKSSSKPLPSKPHPLQSGGGDLKQAVRRPPMPLPKVKPTDS